MKNLQTYEEFLNENFSKKHKMIGDLIKKSLSYTFDYDTYKEAIDGIQDWCIKNSKNLVNKNVYTVSNKYKDFEEFGKLLDETPESVAGFIEGVIDDIDENY